MSTCHRCIPPTAFENAPSLWEHVQEHHCGICQDKVKYCRIHAKQYHYELEHKGVCPFCNQEVYVDKVGRDAHIRQEHQKLPCSFCWEVHDDEEALQLHLDESPLHPYKCMKCHLHFMSNTDMWIHSYYEHYPSCPLCSDFHFDSFNSSCFKWQLSTHIIEHHKLFPCDDCPGVFNSNLTLQHHFMCIHRIICNVCKEMFTDAKALEEHNSSTHHYPCDLCDKVCISEMDLQLHYKRKHKLKCSMCDEVFETVEIRDRHFEVVHQFPCAICGMVLDTEDGKIEHYDSLHQLKCDVCDKMSTTVEELQLHYNVIHPKEDI